MTYREVKTFSGSIPTAAERDAGVYHFVHKETGKVYIGSTNDGYRRFIQHSTSLERGKHFNRKLQRAYDKSPHFNVLFVKVPDDIAGEDKLLACRLVEQALIDEFTPKSKLLNIANDVFHQGSGLSPTPETREKLRVAMTGRYVSEESKRKRSESLKGHVLSQETRDKISKAHMGKKQSDERKAVSSLAAAKISHPIQVNEMVYSSVRSAAVKHGIKASSVVKRINSKNPDFAGWKYVDKQTLSGVSNQ